MTRQTPRLFFHRFLGWLRWLSWSHGWYREHLLQITTAKRSFQFNKVALAGSSADIIGRGKRRNGGKD